MPTVSYFHLCKLLEAIEKFQIYYRNAKLYCLFTLLFPFTQFGHKKLQKKNFFTAKIMKFNHDEGS